jgi:hypothetical protein
LLGSSGSCSNPGAFGSFHATIMTAELHTDSADYRRDVNGCMRSIYGDGSGHTASHIRTIDTEQSVAGDSRIAPDHPQAWT